MELKNVGLLVLGMLLLVNQVVLRSSLVAKPWVFYGLQVVHVGVIIAAAVAPIPAFQIVPTIRVVVVLGLILRMAYNWRLRAIWFERAQRAAFEAEMDAARDENERLKS